MIKTCGPECYLCDCGRTDNDCKFKESKIRFIKKKLGLIKIVNKKSKKSKKKKGRK